MKALICGVNGQDGSYLAQLLLAKGYEVWGTSRDVQTSALSNLRALDIADKLRLVSMAPNDFRSVLNAFDRSDPDEVYYLCAQSSVGLSFEQPAETLDSIVMGVLNLLEVIRLRKKTVRFYHASSSECFGDTGDLPADENFPFRPRSPYAVAKASAHWLVSNYRESYGLYACNGILFNHESPLRPARFVTRKIIQFADRIGAGSGERLKLGRLDICRDWGWAPEYVGVMWRMLQADQPDDYVVATGESHTLEDFVAQAFARHDMDWREHVEMCPELFRPTDLKCSLGNPTRVLEKLNWQANYKMQDVVRMMSDGD